MATILLQHGKALVGAGGIAGCALLGAGGAAAAPGGVALGAPGLGLAVALVAAAASALLSARARAGLAACAGLLLPVALVLSPLSSVAGVRALSGPPLFALALAGLVRVAAEFRPQRSALLFLPLAFAALVLLAARSHVRVGPQGDEPHYLMVADSLLRDGDVSLERDYVTGRYLSFHDAPLAPHFRVRGKGGEVYSLHAVGLSVAILPAWALAGYAGVTVWMAFIGALLAREARLWVRDLTGRDDLGWAAAALLVFSPPLAQYAGLVFTEVPAALAFSFGLRQGRDPASGWRGALAAGLAAAALPWLNVRYAPLAIVVLAHAAWRSPARSRLVPLLGPPLASAVGIALYHRALYGFLDPRRVYGRRPEFAWSTLPEGAPGLLLDQEFGLLVYAPVLLLGALGLRELLRRDRRLGLAVALAVVVVFFTAASWHMWRGGFNPPGRFLVPVAPLLLVSAMLVLQRRGLTAGVALLVGWGLWTGIGGALEPQLVHRDRDETAPFFRQLSGAREWTGLLPSYVLAEPDRHRLAAVWAAALLLALPWRRGRATAAGLAVSAAALALAAQSAAALSDARTEARDAVRVVGRASLVVPAYRLRADSPARWLPPGWGPLFEPHRHPGGAPLGERLPLRPGRYRLTVEGESLAPAASPRLEVVPDRPNAPGRSVVFRQTEEGLAVEFAVAEGEPGVTLRLRGGGARMVRSLLLQAQPSGRGPV